MLCRFAFYQPQGAPASNPNHFVDYNTSATAIGRKCGENAMSVMVDMAQRLGLDELRNYGNCDRFMRTNVLSVMPDIAAGACTSTKVANHLRCVFYHRTDDSTK